MKFQKKIIYVIVIIYMLLLLLYMLLLLLYMLLYSKPFLEFCLGSSFRSFWKEKLLFPCLYNIRHGDLISVVLIHRAFE